MSEVVRGGVPLLVCALLMLGCDRPGGAAPEHHGDTEQAVGARSQEPAAEAVSAQEADDGYAASPAHEGTDGARRFGGDLADGTPEVALAELLSEPGDYADQRVRTRGTIGRVCKAMGCWMELRTEDGEALRAPMAGHAFFLPQDVVGRAATVEGTLRVAPLNEAQKAHYRAEGMQAVDVAASLDAEAVLVAGS